MSQSTKKNYSVFLTEAYNNLTRKVQAEARNQILTDCEIDHRKFYRWLKQPHLLRKPDRQIFAKAFNSTEEDLFGTE